MKVVAPIIIQLFFLMNLSAQPTPNYDESRVPPYALPDVLTLTHGEKVKSESDWTQKRRPEIIALFEQHVYGNLPAKPEKISFREIYTDPHALSGKAIRKEVEITVTNNNRSLAFRLLLYLPQNARQQTPVFLGLNFFGNHAVQPEPGISITTSWMPDPRDVGVEDSSVINHKATEKSRGMSAASWPVELILSHGFGLATLYYGDLLPDYPEGYREGVFPLFGDTKDEFDKTSAISVWAWGLMRAMDYLVTDRQVDAHKVALIGHSRLGKTALWAGALDPRFALIISNNSGCGGAALSKRIFGETVGSINRAFPHWFCKKFKDYNEHEDLLPVDQHMLLALCAPRPLYVASAVEDAWADPKGEFLSALHADPVYKLMGKKGLLTATMPLVNIPSMGTIGYHIRPGKHELSVYDWEQYLAFAGVHLKR